MKQRQETQSPPVQLVKYVNEPSIMVYPMPVYSKNVHVRLLISDFTTTTSSITYAGNAATLNCYSVILNRTFLSNKNLDFKSYGRVKLTGLSLTYEPTIALPTETNSYYFDNKINLFAQTES